MIKKIRIKNFKCLKDTGEIEIKPLTFFVGPNSSGKTSFFQFLLALRQTSQCNDFEYPLVLQDYIDLGSYKDIVFGHNEQNKIEVYLTLENPKGISKLYSYIFALQKKGRKAGKIYLDSTSYEGPFSFIEIEKKATIKEKSDDPGIIAARFRELKFKNVKLNIINSKRKYFKVKFLFPNELIDKETKVRIGHFHRIIGVFGIFPMTFYEISNPVVEFFSSLFHIGPLREEPQRVYTGAGIVPKDVGKTGKWSVDALLIEKDAQKKAKYWLNKFGIASEIYIRELKKGSKRYEVILNDINTGIEVNLTDVGFGTSQTLPIIIECFITPENSILLLEQPEIHLHPKGQAIMADLLVEAVKGKNKTIFIETHSDLMLSRVCTSIVKGDISQDKVVIYYFDPKQDGTHIQKINITQDGRYENFPEGFFEERYEEAKRKTEYLMDD